MQLARLARVSLASAALALTLGAGIAGCATTNGTCAKCGEGACTCADKETCPTCGKAMKDCVCAKPSKPSAMGGPAVKDTAKPTKVATANNVCPVGGDEFNAAAVPVSLTRVHNGKTIGFCCPSCPEAFDQANAAGKDKLFAEAMAHPAK